MNTHINSSRRSRWPVPSPTAGGLFLLAILLRLLASYWWWEETSHDPDLYAGLAREMLLGAGFCVPGTATPTAFRPPGYPLFLMTLQGVDNFDPRLAIPLWNLLFDLMTMGFVWNWLRGQVSTTARLAALLVLACDPLMIRYQPQPMTELCFTCWSTAGVLLLANLVAIAPFGSPQLNRDLWGIAGGLLGMAALCRPTIWPFLGVIVVFLLTRAVRAALSREVAHKPLAILPIFVGSLLLFVGPWVLRNQLVFGTPILTTTHGGYTLLLANNPVFYREVARQRWGTVWEADSLARWQQDVSSRMQAALGPGASEVEQDRWQSAEAWRNIQAEPGGFLAAMLYRVRSFWSLAPRGPAATAAPAVVNSLVGGWYLVVFALAAYGTWIGWQRRLSGGWVLLASGGCLLAVHLFYWTDTRMRLPVHPLLAIGVALACHAFLSSDEQKSQSFNPVAPRNRGVL